MPKQANPRTLRTARLTHRSAEKGQISLAGRGQRAEQAKQGAFACAIAASDQERLASFQAKIKMQQDPALPLAAAEALGLYDGLV